MNLSTGSLSLLLIATLLVSCGSQGSNAPLLSGNFGGHVYVVDSFGAKMRGDPGVIVSIPQIHRSTRTDFSGAWSIEDLVIGSYDIFATKPGYGTMKWFEQKVVGPGTYYCAIPALGPIPKCSVTLDSVVQIKGQITLFGSVSNNDFGASLTFTVDEDSMTLPNEPHLTVQPGVSANISNGITNWSLNLSPSIFYKLVKGKRVYFSVYPYIYGTEFQYRGSMQWLPIAPGKKSNSLPFIIP
jgi:hypothetical protein